MTHHTDRARTSPKTVSTHSAMESDSEYDPGAGSDPVTTACRLVHESPQPMKDMKKTNKVPTAAEQFSTEHHGEYEARARQSGDKIGRVERHNQVYPKMNDELDKRSSISRVVAVTMSRRDAMKLGNASNLSTENKRITKPSSRANRNRRSKAQKPKTKKKVTKRKNVNRTSCNRSYRLPKIWKSRGCQCFGNSNLTDVKDNSNDVVIWARNLKRKSKMSQCSNGTEKFPPTSEPTVSSYHSFSSMEQEPMV